jgi:hypothetical protein
MEYILLLQILITEIHPTPAGGEPEWVECAVTSASAIDLGAYVVCDNRTCIDLPALRVGPGELFVITRDAEALRESRMISKGIVVAECAMPSLNNTSDRVEIRHRDSALVEMVEYAVSSVARGRSIERHGSDSSGRVMYSQKWTASAAFDSATCGRINSHVEYEHDLAVTGHFVQDSVLHIGLVNNGRIAVAGHTLQIIVGMQRYMQPYPLLQPKQWWSAQIGLMELMPSESARSDTINVQIVKPDMRMENNVYISTISIPPMNGRIMITEILADPYEGDGDFVELWNGTSDTIDVSDWTLQDQTGEICRIIGSVFMPPTSYVACSSDTAILRMTHGRAYALLRPMLNVHAQHDTVLVRTSSGFIVDKAPYNRSWHSSVLATAKGRSLEKRVPQSIHTAASDWSTSTDASGSTPGTVNSMEIDLPDITARLTASPSPFSVLTGSARHPCVISWMQPFEQAQARIFVLRLDGSVVAELLNGAFIGRQGAVTWNGLHTATQAPLSIGIYIAAMECIDANSDRVVRATCPVVIGQTP